MWLGPAFDELAFDELEVDELDFDEPRELRLRESLAARERLRRRTDGLLEGRLAGLLLLEGVVADGRGDLCAQRARSLLRVFFSRSEKRKSNSRA